VSLEQIAKVLTEHQWMEHDSVVNPRRINCCCGFDLGMYESASSGDQAHAAHQAAMLAPLFAAAKAEAWDECENAKYEIRLNTGSNTWGAVKDNPYRTT